MRRRSFDVFGCCDKMGVILGSIIGLLITFLICIVRLFLVLRNNAEYKPGKKGAVSVLVVAGSGGHTTEILRLMESLSRSYSPRHYVIADTDKMSEDKIRTLENSQKEKGTTRQFTIQRIPRSREVQQSWSSSVLTTLYSLLYSVPLVFKLKPDLMNLTGKHLQLHGFIRFCAMDQGPVSHCVHQPSF
ncbi:UDP-N-acetylglucosamine transferase subunit ALG14 homolog isoform X2 [Polyodon spathula]|uniref:UDP-N-acetylglucosamine transferase subunit ALG14 homolog isoform X2 n=1 Tax=Polyodon spathula TaxID=7913 RepID=UPI001B7F3314|nr:UDP-N-acetylglucosamine transferase subunit ALG14 homolog isoform X2 [Polyodon spathula]